MQASIARQIASMRGPSSASGISAHSLRHFIRATLRPEVAPIASISAALPNGWGKPASTFAACRSGGVASSRSVTTKPPPTE